MSKHTAYRVTAGGTFEDWDSACGKCVEKAMLNPDKAGSIDIIENGELSARVSISVKISFPARKNPRRKRTRRTRRQQ